MELIDHYLHSVREYLPEAQQDDIVRELSENIRSRQEEKEDELGRPLRQDEIEGMLKQLGHPMLMAGRYLPHKQLIGSAVFPYYWFTLKGTLWLALILYILAVCTTPFVADIVAASREESVPELLRSTHIGVLVWGGIGTMFAVFGIVTAVFALLDLFQDRYHLVDRWDPKKLVPVPRVPAEFLGKPISRPQAISQLVVGVVFTLCWLTIPHFPMIIEPGFVIQHAAGWHTLQLFLLAVVLASSMSGMLGLIRPHWMRWVWPLVHSARAAGLFWLFRFARSGNLVATATVPMRGVDPQFVEHVVNSAIAYGILLALCFTLLNSGLVITRYLAHYIRRRSAAGPIHLATF
jgi:hypothetical protein